MKKIAANRNYYNISKNADSNAPCDLSWTISTVKNIVHSHLRWLEEEVPAIKNSRTVIMNETDLWNKLDALKATPE